MNITEYSENNKFRSPIAKRCATIGKDFSIIRGDEFFYEFISRKNVFQVEELLHPDDKEMFLEAIESCATEAQYLIARIMDRGNGYRYFEIYLAKNGIMDDDYSAIDITLIDVIAAEKRLDVLEYNLRKYRRFMSTDTRYFFEYNYETNVFQIYVYINERSNMIVNEDFDEFCDKMIKKYLPSSKDVNAFETFRNFVLEGIESFRIQINSTLLSQAKRIDNILFSGGTIYSAKIKIVVGTMILLNRSQMQTAYYMTEAGRDSATGVMNKRALTEYVIEKMKANKDEKMYVIMLDVDNFKSINDTHGHLFGDEIISNVAGMLNTSLSNRGVIGRFGGDEFVIVVEKISENWSIESFLKMLNDNFMWISRKLNKGINVTASVGMAEYPANGATYEEVFGNADKALYAAKKQGKNRYVIYNSSMKYMTGSMIVDNTSDLGEMVTKCVIKLHKEGQKEINNVIKTVCDTLEISGVEIFAGNELELLYKIGKIEEMHTSMYSVVSDEYFDSFIGGKFICNDTEGYPKLFAEMRYASEVLGIKSFAQFLINKNDKPHVVCSFFNKEHGFQWRQDVADALLIISGMIAQVLEEVGV